MWIEVRRRLNASRHELGLAANRFYPEAMRVGSTSLLTRPGWIPEAPVPLENVRLDWDNQADPPAVADPAEGLPKGLGTYAEAMEAMAAPRVFENRPCYRLLDVELPLLRFGPAMYFDGVNVGEAVAHELAARADGTGGLPLRERIGDPTDLTRRAALPAITTVTIRAGDGASYVLHWRDPEKVVHAGGLHQVMPVGVFQPLNDDRDDLDLWRSMQREFSEEFLGTPEIVTWTDPPFRRLSRSMDNARDAGAIRPYLLGLGVDPLTFALDLLTVVIVEADTFDLLFGGLVNENDEGRVSMVAFDGTVPQPMQPAGAAALQLAWRHRTALGL
ncbi:hypothetical protein J4573_03735 [Actinomadura barringtoniae]|uniref:Uncharacterized protein n=1 Tax=Actinomadura barringtoniae TaxID=1427535 RepID=A0A939P678_9ACTN|nr:hypothetical protein [Actinomadura barringtoniae]MBO2446187.1 hypothetical protein [Actinomadura barringtoniae]